MAATPGLPAAVYLVGPVDVWEAGKPRGPVPAEIWLPTKVAVGQMLQFQRLVQRITVSGASVCPDCGAHSAPLSPMVFGVSLMDPSLETHMALTIVSLTSHIAGFDIAPLATDLTTRN